MTIHLGSDHAGFALRRILANYLIDQGHAVAESGPTDESAFDYPLAAAEVAKRVVKGEADMGVLICGTGIGMAIAANRFAGVRAANCWNEESAKLAREHNHANVLCLGARMIAPDQALSILKVFLAEAPSQEARHLRRVQKLDEIGECAGAPPAYCK
ncbi:MAG: ribose 5-phosphate isomerase B [Fimbriimonadales bacterium]|nr:ribose 5-phosphate isomerase B [Fimbriimonadales bacterium]